jgi:hypothetical protein
MILQIEISIIKIFFNPKKSLIKEFVICYTDMRKKRENLLIKKLLQNLRQTKQL